MTTNSYPHQPETTRPYRLWNANDKKLVAYRHYFVRENAHWGALKELRWAKPGLTIEVINVTNMKLICQYTRTATGFKWLGAQHHA